MVNKLSPCPFCGSEVVKRVGMGGVDFFYCRNDDCGAIVSFRGENKTNENFTQALDPVRNFNKRFFIMVDKSKI